MHVEFRTPVFVNKERSHAQDFVNPAQGVKDGNDIVRPAFLRADNETAGRAGASDIYRNGAPDPVFEGEIFNRIGETLSGLELQGKNASDGSLAVLHRPTFLLCPRKSFEWPFAHFRKTILSLRIKKSRAKTRDFEFEH
jgi:hypothetical protein